jgi:anti-sigma factor RsiW
MTACSQVVALLLDYLEQRLPRDRKADLDRHLAGCPNCLAALETYRTTVSLLGSLEEEDLPDDLRLRLRAFLDRECGN